MDYILSVPLGTPQADIKRRNLRAESTNEIDVDLNHALLDFQITTN